MSILILDDKFDDLYLHEFARRVGDIPVCQDNVANRYTYPYGKKGTHKLQGACIFRRDTVNRVIHLLDDIKMFFDILEQVETLLGQKYFLSSIDLNVQHRGADGVSHTDATNLEDLTIMMMVNPTWNPEWGGQFELMNKDETEVADTFEFVPGRIIVFPGIIPHRGLGPCVDGVYRSTVVWRVTPLDVYMKRVKRGLAK